MSRNASAVVAAIAVFAPLLSGCGDSGAAPASISGQQQTTSGPGPRADQTAQAQAARTPFDLSTPKSAVGTFLEAVRRGDVEASLSVLTPLARQRIEEYELPFAPVGNDKATFQIGETFAMGAGKAEVATVWTEVDERGQPLPENTRWTVKKSDQEWRISGMTSQLSADEPPVALDFENPEALIRELGLGAPPAETNRQAGRPEDPFLQSRPQ